MAKRYLVLGLGKSGISVAAYLYHNKADFILADTRKDAVDPQTLKEKFPNIPVHLGEFSSSLLEDVERIVLSPGISGEFYLVAEAKKRGIEVIGDIELFCQRASAPIIAITGTNAKSTVVTMVAKMISDAGYRVGMGGNIGIPALDLLDHKKEEPDYYVLELSSFQLETARSLKAKVSCVLNVSPDHMDRYKNFDAYVKTKQRIYDGCEWAIYNRNDENTYPATHTVKRISFGCGEKNNPSDVADQKIYSLAQKSEHCYLFAGDDCILVDEQLKITGYHNYLNCLAAIAICDAIGIDRNSQIQSLSEFSGLKHRCELVANIAGVQWINDSKGTNVGATLAALESFGRLFPKKIILILGGVSKDASFFPLIKLINRYVKNVLVYGEDSERIEESLKGSTGCKILKCSDLKEVVSTAGEIALTGELVLFSPACASFDMFKNFEHRGEEFESLIHSRSLKTVNSGETV